jgi:hypothetical protein
MSARIEYAPGEAWCVAAGRAVLVCERDLPPGRARALHAALAVVDTTEALRVALDGEPSALIGLVDLPGGRALLRRHGVPATADGAALADRFGADWSVDEVGADAVVAAGGLGSLAGDTLPFEGGVARVAAVRVAAWVADASAPSTAHDPVEQEPEGGPRYGAFGQTLPPAEAAAAAARAASPSETASPTEPAPPSVSEPSAEREPMWGSEPAWEPAPPSPAPAPAPVLEPAATVPEPEPITAPRPIASATEPVAAPQPAPALAPLADAVPTPAPALPTDTGNPIGGLIDSVPGFIKPAVDVRALQPDAPAAPAPAAPAAPASARAPGQPADPAPAPAAAAVPSVGDVGDHDGMTITAEQARRMQAERARQAEQAQTASTAAAPVAAPAVAPAAAPATGPLVLSTLCPNGHVNAPGSTSCIRCGAAVDEGSTAQRRRPEVAVAVLVSGERIPLGRGVVIGRRPRSRRVEDGRVPRLVTVDSPGEDISRSHLELRIDDWNLVAVDLSSTNGTLLLREGAAPQRLRPEASTILQLGDRLDLGDGQVVTIESAP